MRRILLVEHPHYTSATFYLWHGLKELESLFPDRFSVSCYPFIPTHYDDAVCDYRSMEWFQRLSGFVEDTKRGAASLPHGIPAFQPGEYLTSENVTLTQKAFSWSSFPKQDIITGEDQAVRELGDHKFDLVVLGNSHRVPTILLAKLRERVGSLPPIVYFDAGERDELNEHWVHVFRPVLTFKQILTPAVKAKGLTVKIPGLDFKMYPMPLSSPIVDRDVQIEGLPLQWLRRLSRECFKFLQVFYSMSNTWPGRAEVVQALNEMVLKNDLDRIKGCGYQAFHYVLAHSRMGVTMRGSGRDTTRYWEIPLYKTAMVCDGTMGCIHPYPFEHQKTAFFYRSVQELVEIMLRTVNASGDVERIALAGQEHLERYHSTAARAVFFLDILNAELRFADQGLLEAIGAWKSRKGWDGRHWEGPVV
jgi:hypothetical protein